MIDVKNQNQQNIVSQLVNNETGQIIWLYLFADLFLIIHLTDNSGPFGFMKVNWIGNFHWLIIVTWHFKILCCLSAENNWQFLLFVMHLLATAKKFLEKWKSTDSLTLYLIETLFNTFANRADTVQAALVRAAWSGFSLFADGNMIRYGPTLVDLASNFFVLCTNMKVHL